jgi:hypothetical protein
MMERLDLGDNVGERCTDPGWYVEIQYTKDQDDECYIFYSEDGVVSYNLNDYQFLGPFDSEQEALFVKKRHYPE